MEEIRILDTNGTWDIIEALWDVQEICETL